jgi:hypothetical protein
MKRNTILVIFLIAAASAALVFRFAMPVPADKALAAAFVNLGEANHFSGVVTVGVLIPQNGALGAAAEGGKVPLIPLALHGTLLTDLPAGTGARASGVLLLSALGAGEGGKDMYAEARAVPDGRTFIKFDGVPATGGLVPATLNGNWFLLGSGTATEPGAAQSDDAAAAAAAYERVHGQLGEGSVFVSDGSAALETLGKRPTYRYALRLRPESQTGFVDDLVTAFVGRALTDKEKTGIEAALVANDLQIVVWVDRATRDFRRIEVDLTSRDPAAGGKQSVQIESIGYASTSGVEVPAYFQPLSDLFARPTKPSVAPEVARPGAPPSQKPPAK